ncbi:signal peptide peptidase SppA [Myxococcota bacterium]|nr:signal peptide peptidase SppA [Myxococcota bacterium]
MNDQTPKRRGLGCVLSLFVGMFFLGLFALLGGSLLGLGSGPGDRGHITETIEEGDAPLARKIAIIPINGVLTGGPRGQGSTAEALKMMRRALKDEAVVGVLLEVDTPGGSVTDADLLHRQLTALRKAGKPTLLLMGDLCASGGYYMAVAAEEIWAMPTTVTGSIGVIIQTLNLHKLLEAHGVEDRSIMSGRFKGLLSPTRPEQPEGRALLQGVVDALYERFLDLIVQGRGLTHDELRPLADGRVFTAQEALKAKLIDKIGYPQEALTRLKEILREDKLGVVRYQREGGLMDLLRVRSQAPEGQALLESLFATPRAMYLFAPQPQLRL